MTEQSLLRPNWGKEMTQANLAPLQCIQSLRFMYEISLVGGHRMTDLYAQRIIPTVCPAKPESHQNTINLFSATKIVWKFHI